MIRIHVNYTACELEILRQETGHSNIHNYIRNRTEILAKQLPEGPCCQRIKTSHVIADEEAIQKLDKFCEAHNLTRAAVVRRLVVDPLVLPRLLGGVPVF